MMQQSPVSAAMFNSAMISSAVQCPQECSCWDTKVPPFNFCWLFLAHFCFSSHIFATKFSKNIDLADQTHLEDGLKCKKNTLGLQFNAAEWLREYIGMLCLRLSSHCNSVCCEASQNSGTSEGKRIVDW